MKMEVADIRLTLGGEHESIKVNKKGVSVAEAMVLTKVHGDSAVHNIKNIREVEVSAVAHKKYLSDRYMKMAGDESKRDVASLLFPGLAPNFPSTYAESGLVRPEVSEDEVVDAAGNVPAVDTGISEILAEDDGAETQSEDLPPTKAVGGGTLKLDPDKAKRGANALAAALD